MDLELIKTSRERHSKLLGQVCHCTYCELSTWVEAGTAAGVEMAAEIERLQARVARLEARLSDCRSAASDVLAETAGDTERTFDAAFHKACLMNGTLQFIVEHAAPTEAAPC